MQLKQPPHHHEEEGTRVSTSLMPQSQKLLIYPPPWCIPFHTELTLRESIVDRLTGQKNARHPEGGTEDGI